MANRPTKAAQTSFANARPARDRSTLFRRAWRVSRPRVAISTKPSDEITSESLTLSWRFKLERQAAR